MTHLIPKIDLTKYKQQLTSCSLCYYCLQYSRKTRLD